MKRKWLRPLDVLIACGILLSAFLLRFCIQRGPMGDLVEIYVGNTLCETLSMDGTSGEHIIRTDAGEMHLSVTTEGVRVTHADCPDKLCVRMGSIAEAGESIVCVPLGVCVTVGESAYDGVTG